MGLFSRKKAESPSAETEVRAPATAWQLAPKESTERLTSVEPEVLEDILESSGNPNKNQKVTVAVTAVGDQSLAAHWDGRLVGHLDGLNAIEYVPGLRFLTQTDRYGIVTLEVASRKSKFYGSASLFMPYAGRVFVPFNQPPEGYEIVNCSPTVKNERFHVGDLERIAPADGTPGWFLLEPQSDGEVLVYAPEYGHPRMGLKVGAIIKADLPATREVMDGRTVAVFGRVDRFRGLDIRLGPWA